MEVESERVWKPTSCGTSGLRRYLRQCHAVYSAQMGSPMRPADELAALNALYRRQSARARVHHPLHQQQIPPPPPFTSSSPSTTTPAAAAATSASAEEDKKSGSSGGKECGVCGELDKRFALGDFVLRLRALQRARSEESREHELGMSLSSSTQHHDHHRHEIKNAEEKQSKQTLRRATTGMNGGAVMSGVGEGEEEEGGWALLCEEQVKEWGVESGGYSMRMLVERETDARWSLTEELAFEHALLRFGKCFWRMQRAVFPQRSTRELVNYYFVRYKQRWMQAGGDRCPRNLLHFQNIPPPAPIIVGTWPTAAAASPSASAPSPFVTAPASAAAAAGAAGFAVPSGVSGHVVTASRASSPPLEKKRRGAVGVIAGGNNSGGGAMVGERDTRRKSERSALYARRLLEMLAKNPLERFPPEQGMSATIRTARERRALLLYQQQLASSKLPPSSSAANLNAAGSASLSHGAGGASGAGGGGAERSSRSRSPIQAQQSAPTMRMQAQWCDDRSPNDMNKDSNNNGNTSTGARVASVTLRRPLRCSPRSSAQGSDIELGSSVAASAAMNGAVDKNGVDVTGRGGGSQGVSTEQQQEQQPRRGTRFSAGNVSNRSATTRMHTNAVLPLQF